MVTIIPKPIKKIPIWHNFILYVALGLLTAVILAYVLLIYFENNASNNLVGLEDEIAKLGTREEKALELEILTVRNKINKFAVLLAEHRQSSNIFPILEWLAHPQVWFSSFSLDIFENQVNLSGQTLNFQTLGQQLYIFQTQPLIENVNLSELAIGKEGGVEFNFDLTVDPQIFNFNE